ncbi:hypothetical protein GF339_18365, partial [candidate division KSB3 bacterium]|nr:hypothetical protein [candidate division KSB3 bacterium]MBD3326554.1 hypothetical protein [candidate division KSB3 bacterium]
SGHADHTAEAFSHWDQNVPQRIPEECAKCHSTPGYLDFLGVDGSPARHVDAPAPVGTTVECIACHNEVAMTMDSVVMPSGLEITGLGEEARCMQCHQGQASKFTVDAAIDNVNLPDPDTVSPDLEFVNIHYYAAVATKYGTMAKSGYEYDGKTYDTHFSHITDLDPCIDCHYAHTQQIKLTECQACHEGVTSLDDIKDIRMYGSLVDYDGDGNMEEGMYYEIVGLQDLLYQAIQRYAQEISAAPIVYDLYKYPYFFVDSNQNGQVDNGETKYPNKYNAWTPRLLKAAYNYQLSIKDPGMFAHGGKYIIQLLYDSLEDLNAVLSTPIPMTDLHRIDDGHFAGSEEAFRHWDAEGVVPAACSKCHTVNGLPLFLKEGVTISQPASNGIKCITCHDDLENFSRYEVESVKFPSGAKIDSGDPETNVCMNCHQGRESTVSVNNLTQGLEDDKVSETLQFLNIHYFAAGATLFGTEAQGGYEYSGKEYAGRFMDCGIFHQDNSDYAAGCLSCHTAHGLEVDAATCTPCHQEVHPTQDVHAIRTSLTDYDGDDNTEEGITGEIATMSDALYKAIQTYAIHRAETPLVYDSSTYPYFFIDTNGDGKANPDELRRANRYHSWTPRLLKAAYNYQYSTKDPGAFAHNGQYILQLLYDSLDNLGVDVAQMSRP